MRGTTKAIIVIAAGLVAIFIILALLVPKLVDPNQYKGLVEDQVHKITGRSLSIKGPIGLTVIPTLGLTLADVELSAAPDFGPQPMVSVQEAQLRVALMPLLSRQVQADKIIVKQPVIRIGRDKAGRMAWDDIVAKLADGKETAPASKSSSGAGVTLNIAGLEITKGKLIWSDGVSNSTASVDELNASVGNLTSGRSVPASFNFAFAATEPQAKGTFSFKGAVLLNTAAKTAGVSGAQLGLVIDQLVQKSAKGQANTMSGKITLAGDVDANYGHGSARIKNFTLTSDLAGGGDFKTLKLTGKSGDALVEWAKNGATFAPLAIELNGTQVGSAESISADMAAGQLGLNWGQGELTSRGLNLKALLKGDKIPGKSANVSFVADSADVDYQHGTANVPAFTLTADEFKASGGITSQQGGKASGKLTVAPFSPRAVMAKLGMSPPETGSQNALTKAQLDTNITLAPKAVQLSDIKATLDDSIITGRLAVADFASPDIGFDLNISALNADNYLPRTEAAKGEGPASGKDTSGSGLKNLSLDGTLRVQDFTFKKIKAQNVLLTVRGKNGVFRVDPLSAELYQGRLSGSAAANMAGQQPRDLDVNLAVGGLQIGPFLQDYLGRMGWIGGSTDMRINAKSDGGDELVKTLSGLGDVVVRHGVIRGFTLVPGIIDGLLNSSQGFNLDNSTSFEQLGGNFTIQRGKLDFTNLFMLTKDGRMDAPGASFDLAAERMNVPLKMLSDKLPTIKGSPVQLKEIPLQVSGSFTHPELTVDQQKLQEAFANAARGVVQQQLEKAVGGAIPGGIIPGLGTKPSGEPTQKQTAPQPQQPAQEQGKQPAPEKLLRRGLEGLIRK